MADRTLEVQQALERSEKIATRYHAIQKELRRLGTNSVEAKLAQSLLKGGKLRQAEAVISKLISRSKDNWRNFSEAASRAYFIEGTILQVRGQSEPALANLRLAYTYQGDNHEYAIAYGGALTDAGFLSTAESVLKLLIEKRPQIDIKSRYDAAVLLAQLTQQTGRPRESITYYKVATEASVGLLLATDLKLARLHADFATLLAQLQQVERASDEIRVADTVFDNFSGPTTIDSLRLALALSNYYLQMSSPPGRARLLCESILEKVRTSRLEPHSIDLLTDADLNLGIYYAKHDDFETSEKHLQRVSTAIPTLISHLPASEKSVANILLRYGQTEIRVGDLHKAEAIFSELVGLLDREDVWMHSYKLRDLATALLMLGQTTHQLGNEEKAQSYLVKAIKAYGDLTDAGAYETVRDFARAYEQLALVYENEHNDSKLFESLTEEIATMRLAARTDHLNYVSEVSRALAHRASYYVRRSRWDEARADVAEAESLAKRTATGTSSGSRHSFADTGQQSCHNGSDKVPRCL